MNTTSVFARDVDRAAGYQEHRLRQFVLPYQYLTGVVMDQLEVLREQSTLLGCQRTKQVGFRNEATERRHGSVPVYINKRHGQPDPRMVKMPMDEGERLGPSAFDVTTRGDCETNLVEISITLQTDAIECRLRGR